MIHSLRLATDALKTARLLHLPGRADDAIARCCLPPRMERIIKGVDVHHPRESDACGLDLQFAGGRFLWKFRADSLPSASHLWKALPPTASSQEVARGARSRGGSLRAPQEAHAPLPRIIHLLGAEASLPLRHGRRAEAELSWFSAVGRALVLARRLRKPWQPGNGRILLPPSVPARL